MKRKIFWSNEADAGTIVIVNYLREQWSDKSAEKFLNIVDAKTLLLSLYPEMCESSLTKRGVRRCVITKHVSILYGFTKNELNIFSVVDNRQKND